MNWIELLIILIFCHYLADFGLQSKTIAYGKSWKDEEKRKRNWACRNLTTKYRPMWIHYLIGHGFIHGAVIYLFTGMIWLALIESIVHIIIDSIKISGRTDIHQDQCLHMISKLVYVLVWILIGGN